MGVVSTQPGMTIGSKDLGRRAEEHRVPLALSGRVPIKISLENGPIEPGDMLAASPTRPGYAVKAVRSGWVVGVALEASRQDKDTVLCYVGARSWVAPDEFERLKQEVEELRNDLRKTKTP
jgi:hypothetical protein